MRAYCFLNQRSCDVRLRLVIPEPGVAKRFELGRILVAQNQLCRAATVRDGIFAGARFPIRTSWTGAALAGVFRWNLHGRRWKVGGVIHDAAMIVGEQASCETRVRIRRLLISGEIDYFAAR